MGLTRALMPLLDASHRRQRDLHARQSRRTAAGVLGRLCGHQGGGVGAGARTRRRMGEPRPICGSMRWCPAPSARHCAGRRIRAKTAPRLPLPETLVPLYLHLLVGQIKAESGRLFDAQALARRRFDVLRRCAHNAASPAGGGNPRPAACRPRSATAARPTSSVRAPHDRGEPRAEHRSSYAGGRPSGARPQGSPSAAGSAPGAVRHSNARPVATRACVVRPPPTQRSTPAAAHASHGGRGVASTQAMVAVDVAPMAAARMPEGAS